MKQLAIVIVIYVTMVSGGNAQINDETMREFFSELTSINQKMVVADCLMIQYTISVSSPNTTHETSDSVTYLRSGSNVYWKSDGIEQISSETFVIRMNHRQKLVSFFPTRKETIDKQKMLYQPDISELEKFRIISLNTDTAGNTNTIIENGDTVITIIYNVSDEKYLQYNIRCGSGSNEYEIEIAFHTFEHSIKPEMYLFELSNYIKIENEKYVLETPLSEYDLVIRE